MKTDNKDIVRSFLDYLFRAWEEKYGYVYLKKGDAEKEFNYLRNETESLDRRIKLLDKDIDNIRENYVLNAEFTSSISELVKRS